LRCNQIGYYGQRVQPPIKLRLLLFRAGHCLKIRGSKSRLSKLLGVPRQRISEWLKAKRLPNGELTLLLLEWVQAEEAQQQSPAGAETPAGQKTRSRKSSHEKPKTSPP
jgi:transcriptional regulator with XRE-family HTH domain